MTKPYKTLSLGLLFDFGVTPIPIGASDNIIRDTKTLALFDKGIDVYGFTYLIRWSLPLLPIDPIVGLAISRTRLTPDIWDSSYETIQSNTLVHFDSHRTYPITDETWFRNFPLHFTSSENMPFGIFIDNITGVVFDKIVRLNITIFYL